MSKIDIGDDTRLKGKLIDAEHQQATQRLSRGLMGWIFGLGNEKPGNIAGFVVVASLLLFGLVLAYGSDSPSLSKKDVLLIVAGFISVSLGFLFGRATS